MHYISITDSFYKYLKLEKFHLILWFIFWLCSQTNSKLQTPIPFELIVLLAGGIWQNGFKTFMKLHFNFSSPAMNIIIFHSGEHWNSTDIVLWNFSIAMILTRRALVHFHFANTWQHWTHTRTSLMFIILLGLQLLGRLGNTQCGPFLPFFDRF